MNKGVPVGDGFRVAVGVKSKGENRARGGARRSRKSGGIIKMDAIYLAARPFLIKTDGGELVRPIFGSRD